MVSEVNHLQADIIEWKRQMVEIYSNITHHGALLSFSFPNFKLVKHWVDQIWFLGPAWYQDTKLWEWCHLAAKQAVHWTNRKDPECDILLKVLWSSSFFFHFLTQSHLFPRPLRGVLSSSKLPTATQC